MLVSWCGFKCVFIDFAEHTPLAGIRRILLGREAVAKLKTARPQNKFSKGM